MNRLKLGRSILVLLAAGCGSSPGRPDGASDARVDAAADLHGAGDGASDGGQDAGADAAGDAPTEGGGVPDGPQDLSADSAAEVRADADADFDAGDGGNRDGGDTVSGACGVLGWGKNTQAAVAPGATSFTLATIDGRLEVRRFADGAIVGTPNGWFGAYSVAYSPDGALLGASTGQGFIVWRVADGALSSSIPELAEGRAAALSNDGSIVAVAQRSSIVVRRPAGSITITAVSGIGRLAISPDNTLIAASYSQYTGRSSPYDYYDAIWRVADGHPIWSQFRARGAAPSTAEVSFSPDGGLVAFGPGERPNRGHIVRAADGSPVSEIEGQPFGFSADGQLVIGRPETPGSDEGYAIFRVADGATARRFLLPRTTLVLTAGFDPTGVTKAVIRSSPTAELEIVSDGGQAIPLRGTVTSPGDVTDIATSADGSVVATSTVGAIRVWEVATRTMVASAQSASPGGKAFALSPDGTRLAVGGATAVEVQSIGGTSAPLSIPAVARAVAFSHDGALIATGGEDNTAAVWDARTGALVRTLWNISGGHTGPVVSVAFSPQGDLVATAGSGADHTAKLWRVVDGTVAHTFSAGSAAPSPIMFSRDGGLLISGPTMWSVATGASLGVAPTGASGPSSIGPDDVVYFSGAMGIHRAHVPDLTDLGPVPRSNMANTGGAVRALAIGAGGARLVSSSASPVVRLWCLP